MAQTAGGGRGAERGSCRALLGACGHLPSDRLQFRQLFGKDWKEGVERDSKP